MPGLRGTPAVTITTSAPLIVGVVVGAGDRGVVALDRGALDDVERLALRHAVDDVEQHDVAQFLEAGEQGQRAADLAGADQRDLVACHGQIPRLGQRDVARVLARNAGAGKAAALSRAASN